MCLVGFAWSNVWFDECVYLVQRGFAWSDLHRSAVFQWWMVAVVAGLMSVGVCGWVCD